MNRRGFLERLAVAAAGMTFDPELALWVSGRRAFFDLGSGGKWIVANEALKFYYREVLVNALNEPLALGVLQQNQERGILSLCLSPPYQPTPTTTSSGRRHG